MAWSAPLTAVAGAALTAAQWNASVRDNLLETAPGVATTAGGYFVADGSNSIAERQIVADSVLVTETTTSTSYTDLDTFGPSVTVETGAQALVIVHGQAQNTDSTGSARMSYETSGATSQGPADNRSVGVFGGAGVSITTSTLAMHGAGAGLDLTPGSHTFTAKYSVSGGTGEFRHRRLIVIPF